MGALRAPCLFVLFVVVFFFVFLSFLSFCLLVFVSFRLFAFLPFCLFVFLSFCLCVTTIIIMGSISTTTPIFVPIRKYLNFTTHFNTHFTTNYYHYCHSPPPPPTMFSVPKRNTGKCFERPAKILRGLRRFCNNLGAGAGVLTIWL